MTHNCSFEGRGFALSGNFDPNNGEANDQGNNGNWWSSTANDENNAFNLNLDENNVNPDDNNDKFNGLTLRCLA